jgi:hypothetical protein
MIERIVADSDGFHMHTTYSSTGRVEDAVRDCLPDSLFPNLS